MTNTSDTALEITMIITGFLTDNMGNLLLLVLLIIYRKGISSFISRLTNFSLKHGESELGMNADTPKNVKDEYVNELSNVDEKPTKHNEDIEKDDEPNEDGWFSEVFGAFESGNLDVAEAVFEKYLLNEKDSVRREENKGTYLYLKFEIGKDNSAIYELEELARTAMTDESKFKYFKWVSACLRDTMQYKKNVKLWASVVDKMKSDSFILQAKVLLAFGLNSDGRAKDAKALLINCLFNIEQEEQKANVYDALSEVEKSLGNKVVSIYCKDKSLEFDPANRDELFNSAYDASNEGVDDISIGNYLRLINIDGKNSTALNNLGVRAKEAGFKIIATDNYRKAAAHQNSLAMANQGYMLLAAGFDEEAEKIALEGLELDEPHQNLHSLMTEIKNTREEQKDKWKKLEKKHLSRQNKTRCYTEKYYLGDPNNLKGKWFVNGKVKVEIELSSNKLEASWSESYSGLVSDEYLIKLTGTITGGTFSGKYTKEMADAAPKNLLSFTANVSTECIGFISDDGSEFTFISQNAKDDFSLSLLRKES
jgi:hypothetical protein